MDVNLMNRIYLVHEWSVMHIHLCVHQPITDDDVDRIATCLKVLAEKTPLMGEIFNTDCRQSLSLMLAAKMEEEKELQRVNIASIFSMIHLFILNMNIFNILLCTVMRFTTCLWFKNLFLLPSPSFLSEGTREAKEALFFKWGISNNYSEIYWKQSFLWLLEMIDITANEMYVLCKVYMLFFFLLWQASEKRTVKVQADDPISFAQLVNKAEMGATEVQNSNNKYTKSVTKGKNSRD